MLILLQFFEVRVNTLDVNLKLRAVEQLYLLPLDIYFLAPVVKLVHVVDLIEISDIIADFSKEVYLSLSESIPPPILQLELNIDWPFKIEQNFHKFMDLSVCFPLIYVVHRPSVLYLDEGARLYWEGCKLPPIFADWDDFANSFFYLFLTVEQ